MKRIPANSVSLKTLTSILLAALAVPFLAISGAAAQENPAGPQAPPPEHKMERVIGAAQPEAPPSLPPAQIITAFSKKEDLYQAERPLYSYRRTVRIQEFGPDGKPGGEYNATYQAASSTKKLSPRRNPRCNTSSSSPTTPTISGASRHSH
jgi:hypothetical protein